MEEHTAHLTENKDSKKSKDGFLEAAKTLELINLEELEGLAETMFKGKKHVRCC